MYYASRFEDRLGLLSAVVAVLGCCLVFLGVTMPGGGMSVALPSYAAEQGGPATAPQPAGTTGGTARLVVPSLGVNAAIEPVALDAEAVLTPPDDPRRLGWWEQSARLGDLGRTVLTGHTVHTGGGAFDRLGDVRVGADVEVALGGRRAAYRVTEVRTLTLEEVAARAEELFGQDRRSSSLLLVTCTGWTGSRFTSNVLVTAVPSSTTA